MTNEELTKLFIEIKSELATLPLIRETIGRIETRVNEINGGVRSAANTTAQLCQWQRDHEQAHVKLDGDIDCMKEDIEKGKEKTTGLRMELIRLAVIVAAAAGGGTGVAELIKTLLGG